MDIFKCLLIIFIIYSIILAKYLCVHYSFYNKSNSEIINSC